MRALVVLFALLLLVHGLIHLLGFVKAFGLAELAQLARPVARPFGVVWLAAVLGFAIAAVGVAIGAPWWWAAGALAILLSQVAIVAAWHDARFGTVANVVALVGVVLGFASLGPWSFRAEYDREVARGLARPAPVPLVTDEELAPLPPAVQRYLRLAGAVGQPHVRDYRVRFRGRIRAAAADPWMPFVADQHSFVDAPARLFHLRATRAGLPVDVLHRFAGGRATMRVKAASLLTLVDARGPQMDQAETVTLFNDACVLAPAALLDLPVRWQELDARTVRAAFSHAGHTIVADLRFNDAGELVDFVSDDRYAAAPDGRTFTRTRWSTPVGDYRMVGSHRVASRGEARWSTAGGDFTYGEFELLDVAINVAGQ